MVDLIAINDQSQPPGSLACYNNIITINSYYYGNHSY